MQNAEYHLLDETCGRGFSRRTERIAHHTAYAKFVRNVVHASILPFGISVYVERTYPMLSLHSAKCRPDIKLVTGSTHEIPTILPVVFATIMRRFSTSFRA